MRLARYFLPLVSALFLLATSACHSYKPQSLLSTIPQEVDYLAYIHLEKLSQLVSDETLGYHLGQSEKETLEQLKKHVVWQEILVYGLGDNQYITLNVKDAEALLADLKQRTDSISSSDGLHYALIDGWHLAFDTKQLWLSQQDFFTSLFERSKDLITNKEGSAAEITGIDQLLQQDFGIYLSPFHSQEQIEKNSWLASLAPDLQEKIHDTHLLLNGTFKEKDLQIDYKLVNKAGETITDEYILSQKVDKEILNYLADDCDLVILQGVKGKGLLQLLSKIDNQTHSADWQKILNSLDGTLAFSASLSPNSTYSAEEWSLIAQVKKGEEMATITSLLKVLGVDPKMTKRLGGDYIVSHARYGEFYVGARKRIIFAASRPVNKFNPSFESRPITRAIQSGVGNILLDITPDSYPSTYLMERHNYHFEGYIALRAESLEEGKLLLHNEAEMEGNILNGILKALRPIPVDGIEELTTEEPIEG